MAELFSALSLLLPVTLVYLASRRGGPDERDPQRRLLLTRRTPVASLRRGQVARVVGRAHADDPHELPRAPLSDRPCLAYRVTVARHQGNRWVPIIQDFHTTPFWVHDPTGRALVEAAQALPHLAMERRPLPTDVAPDRERTLAFLREHLGGEPSVRDLRVEEGVVAPGDLVAVVGRAWPGAADDGEAAVGYREQASATVLRADEGEPVLVSNLRAALL